LIYIGCKVGTFPAIKKAYPDEVSGHSQEVRKMKGQAKTLIPVLLGIVTLLLAGVMGIQMPRVRQATEIAETRAVLLGENALELDTAFRTEADAAVRDMGMSIVADLAVDLKHQPSIKIASATSVKRDRG
jgi:hypothetical protein